MYKNWCRPTVTTDQNVPCNIYSKTFQHLHTKQVSLCCCCFVYFFFKYLTQNPCANCTCKMSLIVIKGGELCGQISQLIFSTHFEFNNKSHIKCVKWKEKKIYLKKKNSLLFWTECCYNHLKPEQMNFCSLIHRHDICILANVLLLIVGPYMVEICRFFFPNEKANISRDFF